MREYPGPHTPGEVQATLGLPQTPRHILRHLVEGNKLMQPSAGQYAYPDSEREKIPKLT